MSSFRPIPTCIRERSTCSSWTRRIASPRQRLAVMPGTHLRTKAMRRLAPHFEHRLFLTATPHNGYPESFQALLEMLDPNRFTKGVPPSERERDAVMVRRLKSHLRTMLPDGAKRFPKRRIAAIDVVFPPEERELFELLDSYTTLRMGSASMPAERAASRFVSLLLKKRLLSSPAAFKHTLDQHVRTLNSAAHRRTNERALQEAAAALDDDADDTAVVSPQEQEALGAGRGCARQLRPDTGAGAVGKDACQNGEHRRGHTDS